MANEKNGSPMADSKKSGLVLRPVSPGESGQGLPYAPIDWPKRGDIWRWKVGKRITKSGFMADRNLYLPSSLKKSFRGIRLASLPAVKEFISKQFPDADLEAFLGSFSWKIPSKEWREDKDRTASSSIQPMEEMAEHHGSESDTGPMACKMTSEYKKECSELEEKVNEVLKDLKNSQELEYKMAEERLNAQKEVIVGLYQQLEAERSELAGSTASTMDYEIDILINNISRKIDQIKKETSKLKGIEEVAKGFGRTAKGILKEHFGFPTED